MPTLHSLHAYRLLALFQLTTSTSLQMNLYIPFLNCYLLSINPGSYFNNNNNSLLQNQAGNFKEKTMHMLLYSLMHAHADLMSTNLHIIAKDELLNQHPPAES